MPESRLIPASSELKLVLTTLIWKAVSTNPDTADVISSVLNSEMAIASYLDSIELECPANLLGTLKSAILPTAEFFKSTPSHRELDWTKSH